jgi:hypothetical protein
VNQRVLFNEITKGRKSRDTVPLIKYCIEETPDILNCLYVGRTAMVYIPESASSSKLDIKKTVFREDLNKILPYTLIAWAKH